MTRGMQGMACRRVAVLILVSALALAAQSPPAPRTPGLVKIQLVDSAKASRITLGRVTVLEPAPRRAQRVVTPDTNGVVTIDSLRSGRVIIRINAIGFNPVTDTLRYDATQGLVKRYAMTYFALTHP
jgi:hypothetical protein